MKEIRTDTVVKALEKLKHRNHVGLLADIVRQVIELSLR